MYLDVDKSSVTTTEELKEQQNNVSESFTNYSESSLPDPTENISHAILHSESKPLFQDTITNDQEPGRSSSDETDYRINYSHNNELTSQTAAFNSTDNNPVISEPTLTLAQLDSVGGKDETIQGVSNLMEPNKQPVMYLDVGVYFDKTSVTVGRINPESLQLDVLMTTSPQIAFHENSVNIGEDASKYKNHRNHIHIFDTSVSGTFTITMNSEEKIRLNWTSVLTAFFMKLRIGLLTKTGHQSIRNAVLTIPYATTSIERRSIKMAAKNAFENVRVVSSILSTAVTYAANTQFYMQEEKDQKAHSVFVAQSVRKEFVMAAVEIGPDEIVTKSIITSKNLPECSNYEFLNTQLKLFNGERQTSSKSEKQYNIYKRAAQQLCDSVVNGNKCAEHALFIRSSKNLDRFYNSIFKEQVLNYFEVNEGPLFGACILAERLHPSMYRLPPNIPICDKSWTTFSIDFGPAEGSVQTPTSFSYNGPEIVELNQSAITEREVHLPPLQFRKGFSRVVLSETFLSWKMPLEVDAHYFLDDTHGTEGQVVIIGLKCDEDGVVKIVVDEVNINSLAPIPDFT
ncbi:unnamed protein product [Allacma fusca]|uniref:Uncharacterized protein n=1 Tax=Allacma fusca TaxID=39272 RepID=A0A8J2K2Z5_9HEXA|nr:unnamed protein product [Allacma fusca]